jgi:hypothetical protein
VHLRQFCRLNRSHETGDDRGSNKDPAEGILCLGIHVFFLE